MNRHRVHSIGLTFLLASVVTSLGFAAPEVVRVKAPSAKVRQWFPKGSELVSLPVEEFERLVAKAQAAVRDSRQAGPLILRASHRARWVDGVMVGESTFTVRRASKAGSVALDPFNLNLETSEGKDFQVRTSDTGAVSLWLASDGADEVTIRWRRPARSITTGRSFSLELPGALLSRFDLDLPDDLVPDLFMHVDDPQAKPTPGRRLWRSFGLSGAREIRLRRSTDAVDPTRSLPRVGGPTFVDVGTASVNWRCEWSIEPNAAGSPLHVRFSEGLEPVDVSGPSVESFLVERTDRHAVATIRFRGGERSTTTVTIRGVAPLITGGPWPVPSSEPIDGDWTGGLTTVRLDRSHGIQDCRVLNGRRIAPKSIGATDKNVLMFEPDRPGPAAELTFVDPRHLHSAEVRGAVRFATDKTSLTADLRWKFPSGSMPDLTFEIGDDWSIETITYEDDPLSWHRDPSIGSGGRVRILPPTFDGDVPTITLRINAVRTSSTLDRRFEMPRIRPVGVMIEDEIWLAHADGNRVVVPREVEGLAWLDPAFLKSISDLSVIDPNALEHASAWRWTKKDGRFLATLEPTPRETRSTVEGRGVIADGRLRIDWRSTIRPGTVTLPWIPVLWSIAPSMPIEWTIRDPDGRSHPVGVRPLSATERTSAGFPSTGGAAFAVLVDRDETTTPIDLRLSIDRPWSGSEDVPLLVLPESFNASAHIAIEVEKGLSFRAEPKGLVLAMERDRPGTGFLDDRDDADRKLLATSTYEYRDGVPQLHIETSIPLKRTPPASVRNARLETCLTGASTANHRLSLMVDRVDAGAIDLTMPPSAKINRVLEGGRAVSLATSAKGVSIPLNGPGNRPRRSIVIEYETPAPLLADVRRLRPEIPTLSVPCLEFVWQLSLPKGWTVKNRRHEFEAIGDVGSFLAQGSLNLSSRPGTVDKSSLDTIAATLEHLPSSPSDGSANTFFDALIALDPSTNPILIDTIGVEAIDLRSTSPPGAWQRLNDPIRLESGDVCLIPIDGTIVVTDRRGKLLHELRNGLGIDATRASILSGLVNGVDATRRYVSIDRWRTDEGSFLRSIVAPSSSSETFTFRSPGWPGEDAEVDIESPPRIVAIGLLTAISLITVAFLLSRRSLKLRNRLLAIIIVATVATLICGTPIPGWFRAALVLGAVGIALTGIVPPWKRTPLVREGRLVRASSRRSTVSGALIVLVTVSASAMISPAKDGEAGAQPVFALFPYDGDPGVDKSPDRVVMLLQDLERLRAASEPIAAPEQGRLTSISAAHQLILEPDGVARLSSDFILMLDDAMPGDWKIPTEGAWDIHASVDGSPSPVRMIDDGRFAVVSIARQGRRRLVIDRTIRPNVAAKVDSIVIPINAVAKSRIEVKSRSDRGQIRVEGIIPVSPPDASVLAGEIGTIRTLDVEFRSLSETPTGENKAGFTAMALWDVRPAGDFVRMRVRPADDVPVASLGLSIEPGTQVRLADPGRLATERWAGTATNPVWLASFDPPFRPGEPIPIEIWRPLRSPERIVAAKPSIRHFPKIGVTGGLPFSGVLAFRRPGDWSGRLSARSGFDALDEESFVKAWGALPDEPFTLSGARGFQNAATAEVATAPIVVRRSVLPAITVELGEGRLDVIVDAELKDPRDQSTDLDVAIPPGLIIDEFSAEGLVQMTRPEPGRLHLELASVEKPTRKCTLRGHVLADLSTDAAPVRRYESKIPWLTWIKIKEEPALLTIVSATKPQLTNGPGVTAVPLGGPVAALVPAALARTTYQVEKPGDLGTLSWNVAPPSVSVHLVSRLKVEESNASLDTTIRYATSRGPIEELFLRVPSSWMKDARIELVGHTYQRTSETRGASTFVTLRPKNPIWGAGCLVLRSSRESSAGEVLPFPDVMPLGQGSAEKVVVVERRTVAPIEIEGSSGLQSIDPSRLAIASPSDVAASSVEAYRVKGDTWSLNLRVARDANSGGADGVSRVKSGEITCSPARDGSVIGHARVLIDGRRGSPLRFRQKASSELILCRFNDRPVLAVSDDPGAWSIPIESNGPGVIDFEWTTLRSSDADSGGTLDLPQFSGLEDGLLIRVDVAPGLRLSAPPTSVEELLAPIWLLDRAERAARRLVSLIGRYDRTSIKQERMIRRSLVGYEQDSAQTRRSVDAFQLSSASSTRSFREQIRSRLAKMQALVTDTQLANGFEAMADGQGTAGSRSDSIVVGRSSSVAIYPGTARFFRMNPNLNSVELTFAWILQPQAKPSRFDLGLIVMVAVVGLFATPRLSRWRLPRSRFTSTTLLAFLTLLAVVSPASGFVMLWAVALGSLKPQNGTGPVTTYA